MTVMSTNSSPAKDHFMPGDKFISVNGVNADSGEDLPFKGAVGGEVKVILERDGKTVKVKMNRAVQTNTATKAQMLQGYETWTKEGWEDRGTMITVNPLVAEESSYKALIIHKRAKKTTNLLKNKSNRSFHA